MNYLYGDSTPSQLTSNFLEFLRDAIDFAVAVLQEDDRIRDGRERAIELKAEAEAETKRLASFIEVVSGSIEDAEKGSSDSPTARASDRLLELVMDTHSGTLKGIRQQLASDLAKIDNDEAAARERCVRALETLLLPHDPPETASVLAVAADESGRCAATSVLNAAFGLEWTFEHAIPEKNLWAQPVHVSRLAREMQIQAPQLSGWISKEVKIKPLKLERFLVTELVDDGKKVTVKMRHEDAGFEFVADADAGSVHAVRVGPAEDASAGGFATAAEDVAPLLDLVAKLRAGAVELPRQSLRSAATGGADFRALPSFQVFVRSLIAMMTPIVEEITKRSLSVTRDELILRRLVADDRREEIFASKATLVAKYAALRGPLRALFAPLGLDDPDASVPAPTAKPAPVTPPSTPPPPPPMDDEPSIQVDVTPSPIPAPPPLPSSPPPLPSTPPPLPSTPPPLPLPSTPPPLPVPPPPPPPVPPPPPSRPLPPPTPPPHRGEAPRSQPLPPLRPLSQSPPAVRPRSQPPPPPRTGSSVRPFGAKPKLATLPPAAPPPPPKRSVPPPPAPPPPAPEQVSIEVTEEEDVPVADLANDAPAEEVEAEPESESRPSVVSRNEELVSVLKMIAGMVRNGQSEEAHIEYARLFVDPAFEALRPDEQRQVLRLMVIPKLKPTVTDGVLAAHRIAMPKIEQLASSPGEAVDYELLGVAQVTLGNVDAAREAFASALAMERAKSPGSELVGTLMKRMSEI